MEETRNTVATENNNGKKEREKLRIRVNNVANFDPCQEIKITSSMTLAEKSIMKDLGMIFFRFDAVANNFETLRFIGMQNDEIGKFIKNGDINDIVKLPFDDVKQGFVRLMSDGIISVSNVTVAADETGKTLPDVVVMMYKRGYSSIKEGTENKKGDFSEPYIVCRQSIVDIFDMSGSGEIVGASVSVDTLPSGYTMSDIYYQDSILESRLMHVYKNDTLDVIVKCLDSKSSNDILNDLFETRKKWLKNNNILYKMEPDEVLEKKVISEGYNRDLRSLLYTNNFMYDFYSAFGICKVNFEIEFDIDKGITSLPDDQREIVSNLFEINIVKTVIVKYDFDIDFTLIKIPYVLVMDANNTLFVIGYTKSEDEFVRPSIKIVSGLDDDLLKTDDDNVVDRIREAVSYYDKYGSSKN